jgi:hypothetical protein
MQNGGRRKWEIERIKQKGMRINKGEDEEWKNVRLMMRELENKERKNERLKNESMKEWKNKDWRNEE